MLVLVFVGFFTTHTMHVLENVHFGSVVAEKVRGALYIIIKVIGSNSSEKKGKTGQGK